MPYIKQERRNDARLSPQNAGELNYAFTELIKWYMALHGKSYSTFNDIVGALEGAKLEVYRRVVAPYEDGKRESNGDVY